VEGNFYIYPMEWFNSSIAPLKDLLAFLYKKSKTNDVNKKQVIIELRDNLNVFKNGFINQSPYDMMIDLLSRDAIQSAIKENFSFKKLRAGNIQASIIYDERNKKYAGWTAEKLVDKIDEKIVELKNIKKMNHDSVKDVRNNISLMMSNLYFRMKLLADFIQSG
jgi:uncharacterized protein YllA (UPF0747 family)